MVCAPKVPFLVPPKWLNGGVFSHILTIFLSQSPSVGASFLKIHTSRHIAIFLCLCFSLIPNTGNTREFWEKKIEQGLGIEKISGLGRVLKIKQSCWTLIFSMKSYIFARMHYISVEEQEFLKKRWVISKAFKEKIQYSAEKNWPKKLKHQMLEFWYLAGVY